MIMLQGQVHKHYKVTMCSVISNGLRELAFEFQWIQSPALLSLLSPQTQSPHKNRWVEIMTEKSSFTFSVNVGVVCNSRTQDAVVRGVTSLWLMSLFSLMCVRCSLPAAT